MPELPEVETVLQSLSPHLLNQRIEQVRVRHAGVIHWPEAAAEFTDRLTGRTFIHLHRRGKYLLLELDDGQCLTAHLRMTGRLTWSWPEAAELPHTHAVFHLADGSELRYADVRRFGGFWLLAAGEEDRVSGVHKLGPEPFDPEFSPAYLQEKLSKRRITVKEGILDQSVVAGLGNIYADEVLFAASVQPERPSASLSADEWRQVAGAMVPILTQAIEHKGTTFSDFLDGLGERGANLPFLQAYGRAGQPCLRCGALMRKTRVGGRGTCFCPACQK